MPSSGAGRYPCSSVFYFTASSHTPLIVPAPEISRDSATGLAFRTLFVHIGSMKAATSFQIGCAPTDTDPEAAEALLAAEQDPARIAEQILLLRRFSAFALEEAERLSHVSEEQTARMLARFAAAPGNAPTAPEPRFVDFSLALHRLARIARLSIALELRLIAALRRPNCGGAARTARPAAAPAETAAGKPEPPETAEQETEPREAEAPDAESARPHDELARELRALLPGGLSAGGPFEAGPGIAELEALARVHLQQFSADRRDGRSGETGANGAGPGATDPEAILQSLRYGRPRPPEGRRGPEADARDAAPAPTTSNDAAKNIEPPDDGFATTATAPPEAAPPPTGQSRIGWAANARFSAPLLPGRRPAAPSSAPKPAGTGPP
jgi:hypothetical protein